MSDTTPEPEFPPKPLPRPPLAVHPVCETDPRIAETPPPEDFGIPGIDLDQHGRFKVPKLKADHCLLEQAHAEFYMGLNLDEPRPIPWLWPERVPIGKLTLIEGESNSGTSFLVADMAARVTAGKPWPGELKKGTVPVGSIDVPTDDHSLERDSPLFQQPADAGQPGSVVLGSDTPANCQLPTDNSPQQPILLDAGAHVMFVIGGDDMYDTLLPRLLNMGANVCDFTILSKISTHDPAEMRAGKAETHRRLRLPADLGHLEYQLRKSPDTRLLIVDSLSDFCDTDKQFREALRGLQEIAERCHVAVVATARPKNGRSLRSKLKPSADRRAESVRCVLNVLVDPNDPSQRYLAPARMNFCREPPWLPFRIGDCAVEWGQPLETAPVYQRLSPAAQEKATLLQEAMDCLRDTLAAGDLSAKAALKQVTGCGFSKGTVIRARQKLGVRSIREGFGPYGVWLWSIKKEGEGPAPGAEPACRTPDDILKQAARPRPSRKKRPSPADEFGGVNFKRMVRELLVDSLQQNRAMDQDEEADRELEVAAMGPALANGKPGKNGKNGKNGNGKPKPR